MAMLAGKGEVWQEGRFIKIKRYSGTKIYIIDSQNGKLVEIA